MEPDRILGDLLHTVDGGVCQYAAAQIFTLFIKHATAALGAAPHRLKSMMEQRALARLRGMLHLFYISPDGGRVEQMPHVTLRTFVGTDQRHPVCDAKAKQSRGLFYFAHWLLQRNVERFKSIAAGGQGRHPYERAKGLLRSANCLKDWLELVLAAGAVLPPDECAKGQVLAVKHVVLWKAFAEDTLKPKHHAFVELARRLHRAGNPAHYSTYMDESVNALIARLARSVHPANFAVEVLKKYALHRMLHGAPF